MYYLYIIYQLSCILIILYIPILNIQLYMIHGYLTIYVYKIIQII